MPEGASSPPTTPIHPVSPSPPSLNPADKHRASRQPSLKRAPASSSSSALNRHDGRKITPTKAKERPVTEAIASTISSISRHASTSIASGLTSLSSAAAARVGHQSQPDAMPALSTSPSPIFEAMGGRRPEAAVHDDIFVEQLSALDERIPSSEGVSWASWDRLPARRALIIAYVTGGLQVYCLEEDGQLAEVINFQQILLPGDRVAGRVLCARVQCLEGKQPRLLIVTEGTGSTYVLSTCSLDSQVVDTSSVLPAVASANPTATTPASASMQLTSSHLAIGQSQPPAIHILDAVTLRPCLGEAITDVSSSSTSGATPPPFHLSGRLLAYASTQQDRSTNVLVSNAEARRAPSGTHAPVFSPGVESAKMTTEQMRAAAIEMGAHAGDVARKMGGGLLSGVKSVSEWGSNYVQGGTKSSAAHVEQGSPSPVLQTSPSPSLVLQRRSANGQSPSATSQSLDATTIRVVELSPSLPLIASFRSSSENTSAVRLSSSGSLIFVADVLGHAFHVYEIRSRPACMRGSAATQPPSVLHRLKLLRGVTPAQVSDVLWSPNERCIGVLTMRGSVHIYRLGPLHGPRAKPLGATLTSYARTARPSAPRQEEDTHHGSDSLIAPPVACFTSHVKLTSSGEDNSAFSPSFLDILTFHPRISALTLSRVGPHPSSLVGVGVTSSATAAMVAAASSGMSGLTAMMRRQSVGTTEEKGNQTVASRGQQAASTPRAEMPRGQCRAVAIWTSLARVHDAPEVRPAPALLASTPPSKQPRPTSAVSPSRGWVSLAEVHTYPRGPRAMPTPLYFSHQMHFSAFVHPKGVTMRAEPTLMDICRAATRALDVCETVQITGDSFDAGLASAMSPSERHLSPPSPSWPGYPSSPSHRIPSFPQGQPARRPNWRTAAADGMSIPVRLGQRAGSAAIGAANAARQRQRGQRVGSPLRGEAGSPLPSISFDEDVSYDAYLFADARNAQPSPNGSMAARGASSIEEDGTGTFSSSDTPPTAGSDHDEQHGGKRWGGDGDGEGEEDDWQAARGEQEDVQGDSAGWDSFPDEEFGGRGVARRGAGQTATRVKGPKEKASDDFLVGHMTMDEEAGSGAVKGEKLPSFSRKVGSTTATTATAGATKATTATAAAPMDLAGVSATSSQKREEANAISKTVAATSWASKESSAASTAPKAATNSFSFASTKAPAFTFAPPTESNKTDNLASSTASSLPKSSSLSSSSSTTTTTSKVPLSNAPRSTGGLDPFSSSGKATATPISLPGSLLPSSSPPTSRPGSSPTPSSLGSSSSLPKKISTSGKRK
ncbi:hypothetical protein BDZ90DRAFT_272606 [Jaminaea rosea]|uniref:BCAS3 WD40 domain-containing protein n=1 Tax=Jaminaea rosea TaxID=1569628 RepID=A0A316UXA0_9BASI|nr:hypothetical protein BDZ90DRAFT_272606 [Jaminaea rosea]PWN29929.1 hypothetical protein BDZ90DRAFT_272606 [Jaminaea rosea]